MLDDLTSYQKTAIETVRNRAIDLRSAARLEIDAILERSALNAGLLDTALAAMQTGARIGLHFHPERLSRAGMSVAEGLLCSGVYTNQFVAGLSSGSPSAFPGGERDLWERRLFEGAYHAAGVTSPGRPKYGALDVMYHPDGPAPHKARRSAFGGRLPQPGMGYLFHARFAAPHANLAARCAPCVS